MRFGKCSKCGRHALMKKSVCKSCYDNHIFVLEWYIVNGKVRIPDYSDLREDLSIIVEEEQS